MDGSAVHECGFVGSLFGGFEGGRDQQRVAGDYGQIRYVAFFANRGIQLDRALDVGLLRQLGIKWLHGGFWGQVQEVYGRPDAEVQGPFGRRGTRPKAGAFGFISGENGQVKSVRFDLAPDLGEMLIEVSDGRDGGLDRARGQGIPLVDRLEPGNPPSTCRVL